MPPCGPYHPLFGVPLGKQQINDEIVLYNVTLGTPGITSSEHLQSGPAGLQSAVCEWPLHGPDDGWHEQHP